MNRTARQLWWHPCQHCRSTGLANLSGGAANYACSNNRAIGTPLAKLMTRSVSIMHRTARSAFSALLLLAVGASACGVHEAEPAFRATVLIDGRGISIPLPPPSLVDEPEQEVEVEGEVVGLQGGGDGLIVRITDETGGADHEVPLADGDPTFRVEGVQLDLTDNCLEVWLEDVDGNQGDRSAYQVVIEPDGESVSVVEGCD